MAGYIGSRIAGIQVDGYTQSEANAEFVNDPNAVITVSGSNVGIGTSSPNAPTTIVSKTTTYEGLELVTPSGDGSGEFHIGVHQNGDTGGRSIVFKRGGADGMDTESMRIDSSGNLLVGTTNIEPAENNVTGVGCLANGKLSASRSAAHMLSLNRVENDTNNREYVRFYRVGTANLAGTITATKTNVSYNTTSDYRLKENVVSLDNAATRLAQIPVHRFNFIADPSTTVDGFLAHEVQAIVPEAVTGEKDAVDADGNPEYQGIDQSKLVPLLTAALQEALQKIDALEARVAALEAV